MKLDRAGTKGQSARGASGAGGAGPLRAVAPTLRPPPPAGEPEAPIDEPTISATVITLNAEDTLDRALESVAWVDEIVVVDAGSRDATPRIAREHGARLLSRDWPGYGVQKQRALEAAGGRWILSVDADEVVTAPLAAAIRDAVADPRGRAGFRMERHTRFLGAWLGSRGWWRERKLRLFRADRARFEDSPVHEGVIVDGPVGRLEGALLHDPWPSVEARLEKDNRYTSLEAEELFRAGRRPGALGPFGAAARWFVKAYLKRGAILHGTAGLIHAGLEAATAAQRHGKLVELWRESGNSPPRGGS